MDRGEHKMQYAPARRALAGSVLVLGSVGTVSAVHLDSVPVSSTPDGRSTAAMSPPSMPVTGPAPDSGTSSATGQTATPPSRSDRPSTRRSARTTDRPVTGRDLVDMARGPRGGAVVVPVRDVERTVPLRSTLRTAGHHVIGAGLRSLDDVLDFDGIGGSSRGQRSHPRAFDGDRRSELDGPDFHDGGFRDADLDGADLDGADLRGADFYGADLRGAGFDRRAGYARSGRSDAGVNRATLSWDSDDVSFSRPRCGRHRA
ncbi:MAG TPA: pentapeptide repeat-containing protein [Pseudonocardia sp.]|nr:pentapeptide repeat-containing protein [Pseudonocardia sp.]